MTDTAPLPTSRREQRSWYFYDWAASAFSTTVVTVFIGPYLTDVATNAQEAGEPITVFGLIPVNAASYYPFVIALAVLLQIIIMPIIGSWADRAASKKQVLGITAYIGAIATMGLYFLGGTNYHLGGLLLVVATVAFGCSVVVYNSYLPDIATPTERDGVSSRAWAMGYVGGVILLLVNLALFLGHASFGLTEGQAVRIALLSAGAWWAIFALIPLRGLRNRPARQPAQRAGALGVAQLIRTLRSLPGTPQAMLFILAFFFFNDGIQTVIGLTATYAQEELGLDTQIIIVTVLIVQVVGIAGALILGRLACGLGAKRVVLGSLVVWGLLLVGAYLLPVGQAAPFLALGAGVGFVLGGSQALSRSLFAQLVPRDREAEYFSLYEVANGASSLLGPIIFGVTLLWFDSYRLGILFLVVFFVIGGLLLARVDVARGMVEAEAPARERT